MPTRPLEYEVMFLDMDAYFASVEQMDCPELRGRPVAVTPVLAATGCCIACSYEARAHGVRTGCAVREARRRCPGIQIVQARPDRYIRVQHEIISAIDTVLPITEIESVDECWCTLLSNERSEERARALAETVKEALRSRVGSLTCSIGIAPNRLLAKVAAGLDKPDGLRMIPRSSLPGPLLGLELTDLPGISKGINRRLRAAGILTIKEVYRCSAEQLRSAWGSVLGVYWWHWLRGDHLTGPTTHRRTVGHQHVLAPEYRTPELARGVCVRLLAKAAQRMRDLDYVATRVSLWIEFLEWPAWGDWSPVRGTDDTVELGELVLAMWDTAPKHRPLQIGVRLEGLQPRDAQLPLFPTEQSRRVLMQAIDTINRRGGADTVYLGVMHNARKAAPRRIPFGKPPDLALPDFDGTG